MGRLTRLQVIPIKQTTVAPPKVWYIKYGDALGRIDVATIYSEIEAAVKTYDSDARIVEVRQYPYQVAIYVEHSQNLAISPDVVTGTEVSVIGAIILIALAIAAVLASAGYFINAWTQWDKQNTQYYDKDPDTGDPVVIQGYDAYRAWLATRYPDAAKYLADIGADNWWEGVSKWIPIVLVIIAAAIFVPLLTKLIPGRQ